MTQQGQQHTSSSSAEPPQQFLDKEEEEDNHEVEDCVYEVGGDLSDVTHCRKHATGHLKVFSSVEDFGTDGQLGSLLSDQPPPHPPAAGSVRHSLNHSDVLSWLKCWAALVVRISVTFISDQRPEYSEGIRYPFGERRGQRVPGNNGSGFVWWVSDRIDDVCKCKTCEASITANKEKQYWMFVVCTARHVVFDDVEADSCEITFFDDHPTGVGKYTMPGSNMAAAFMTDPHTKKDSFTMNLYTHDVDFGTNLKEKFDECIKVDDRLKEEIEKICELDDGLDDSTRLALQQLHFHGNLLDAEVFNACKRYFDTCGVVDCWIGTTCEEMCLQSGKLDTSQHQDLTEFN